MQKAPYTPSSEVHEKLGKLLSYNRAIHTETGVEYEIFLTENDKVVAIPRTHVIHEYDLSLDKVPALNYHPEDSGKLLRHYKGGEYTYIGEVYDLVTKTALVEYHDNKTTYLRPKDMFYSDVSVPRFTEI